MQVSFESWRSYFLQNKTHFSHAAICGEKELSSAEKKLLSQPIQQFQRGESSEGFHLLMAANMYNAEYGKAVMLFIKEEQKHAAVLARYMRQEKIPAITKHWTDSVFRNLRKHFGVQHTVMVLLTAEIIAAVFYRALYEASASKTLRKICTQILTDEEMHINFQCYAIQHMRSDKSTHINRFLSAYQLILMAGTTAIVWLCYYQVFRAGGYSFNSYCKAISMEFMRAKRMINGESEIVINAPVERFLEEAILI